jgi:TPR repeat protein
MCSLPVAWPAMYADELIKERDTEGVMYAGAGWDIFFLCPDKALRMFEVAAEMLNPIAAYNAAIMRLERGKEGDLQAAKALLSKASELGDKKAQARLYKLK